ncbi:M48 family metalloprotease [Parvularcula sp. ZS-1/3]|uniref:M48 family metalloprotease n=1 Tax=Parvularcula mediterranea TaxID=2732508 RepID=A0A7Y3RJ95_9PROT|nr:M48 family metalloprotease [Parvularcula mediterranea]NNU15094.1 M48 family metalloprotease [Parvularcula mediterranea]
MARSLLLPALLLLAACATPRADLPQLGRAEVDERRRAIQNEALADALAREERVLRLAWPVLLENEPLCPRVTNRMGLRLGDKDTVHGLAKGLKRDHLEELGWGDDVRVLSVAPGSPAAGAGIMPGDVLTKVGDSEFASGDGAGRLLAAYLRPQKEGDDADEDKPTSLTFERDGEAFTVSPEPVSTCDVRVVSSPSGSINATASFGTLTMYAGLLRAVEDDEVIAFIIAHELAHWAGKHPRKVVRNSFVTGAAFWGPPLYLAAQGLDLLTEPVAKAMGAEVPPFTTLTSRAAAGAVKSADFEREADYAGLYMHVRAGGETGGLADVFQLFSNISPRNSWLLVSHPTTPERQLRLNAAAQEIAAKQAAGEPLIPDGWEVRQPQ